MTKFSTCGACAAVAFRGVRVASRLNVAALFAFATLVALVPGCDTSGALRNFGLPASERIEIAEATSQFRIVPASRAYVNSQHALLVLERELGSAVEQRITLPNNTSFAGENTIMLRVQSSSSASPNRLQLDELLTRFGGAPTPFGSTSGQQFMTAEDRYGSYVYTTRRMADGLVCVLAFRRTPSGARPLPRGSGALDIMLRNCIAGSTAEALAPIGDAAFGLATPSVRPDL